jgi:hypothetical protein
MIDWRKIAIPLVDPAQCFLAVDEGPHPDYLATTHCIEEPDKVSRARFHGFFPGQSCITPCYSDSKTDIDSHTHVAHSQPRGMSPTNRGI